GPRAALPVARLGVRHHDGTLALRARRVPSEEIRGGRRGRHGRGLRGEGRGVLRRSVRVRMNEKPLRANKGFHEVLERDHPYVFIDACMQAWPDADYANAHRHGVTCYSVTACGVFQDLDEALENVMSY